MKIPFERLVSRSVVLFISRELDLAGVKMSIGKYLKIAIIFGFVILIGSAFLGYLALGFPVGIAALIGIIGAVLFEAALITILEFKIDQRKAFVESILPDFLQLTAADLRSGIALDKSLLASARPEFQFFSNDILQLEKQLYGGETLENALLILGQKYRSLHLEHTMRMMVESLKYGGSMGDILNQLVKELRMQLTIQKEVSGQLFMYTIFIAFAALVGAPVLYGLTDKMISVTNTIWNGILQQNPGGFPTTGLSFLKPSPPKITSAEYNNFALAAVVIITGMGSFIVSGISSGSLVRGLRYLPLFILMGLVMFYITSAVIGSIFGNIAAGASAG